MGRSELAVPIVSTQLVTDALVGESGSLENLLGATFVFGMRSQTPRPAVRWQLLGLDPEDRRAARALAWLRAGRCLFRDHHGRVEAVQVDVVAPSLLRAFRRRPRGAGARGVSPVGPLPRAFAVAPMLAFWSEGASAARVDTARSRQARRDSHGRLRAGRPPPRPALRVARRRHRAPLGAAQEQSAQVPAAIHSSKTA